MTKNLKCKPTFIKLSIPLIFSEVIVSLAIHKIKLATIPKSDGAIWWWVARRRRIKGDMKAVKRKEMMMMVVRYEFFGEVRDGVGEV